MAREADTSRSERESERMFTFTNRSSRPTRQVRCHGCGWIATGNDKRTFKKADAHVCPPPNLSDGFPGGFPSDRLVEALYRRAERESGGA